MYLVQGLDSAQILKYKLVYSDNFKYQDSCANTLIYGCDGLVLDAVEIGTHNIVQLRIEDIICKLSNNDNNKGVGFSSVLCNPSDREYLNVSLLKYFHKGISVVKLDCFNHYIHNIFATSGRTVKDCYSLCTYSGNIGFYFGDKKFESIPPESCLIAMNKWGTSAIAYYTDIDECTGANRFYFYLMYKDTLVSTVVIDNATDISDALSKDKALDLLKRMRNFV